MEQIKKWCEGNPPETKEEEDKILIQAEKEFGIKNGKKNPGQMAEQYIIKIFKDDGQLPVKKKSNLNKLRPDLETKDYIVEVKSMRFFNGKGKRGNQGTANEKIDSVFRKYASIYELTGKKVVLVLCGDMMNKEKLFLDAFNKQEFHGNKIVKAIYETVKEEIYVCKPQDVHKFISKIE